MKRLLSLLILPLILACGLTPLPAISAVEPTMPAVATETPQISTQTAEATKTPPVLRVCVPSVNVRWGGAGIEYPIESVFLSGRAVRDFGRVTAKDGGEWVRISSIRLLFINADYLCDLRLQDKP